MESLSQLWFWLYAFEGLFSAACAGCDFVPIELSGPEVVKEGGALLNACCLRCLVTLQLTVVLRTRPQSKAKPCTKNKQTV